MGDTVWKPMHKSGGPNLRDRDDHIQHTELGVHMGRDRR